MPRRADHTTVSSSSGKSDGMALVPARQGFREIVSSMEARLDFLSPQKSENDSSLGNIFKKHPASKLEAEVFSSPFPVKLEGARGPLKKRPTTPVPEGKYSSLLTPAPLPSTHKAHSSGQSVSSASLLRQTSSTFSDYSHHQHVLPQFCLTSSAGNKLMAQPLVATPHALTVPTPASSAHSHRHVTSSRHSIKAEHPSRDSTPGLDLLADQVVMNNRSFHPLSSTTPRSRMHVQPAQVVSMYHGAAYLPMPHPSMPYNYHRQPNGYHIRPHVEVVEPNAVKYINFDKQVHKIPLSERKPTPQSVARTGHTPPEDPIMSNPMLFRMAQTSRKPCHCKKSKCLKLYCECFHRGTLCDSKLCQCEDCGNNHINNTPRGLREYAILKILARSPDAFDEKTVKRRFGSPCQCQKNSCLKKYCECVARGRKCHGECKCKNCGNEAPRKTRSIKQKS